MAHAMNRLSATAVKALKTPGFHSDGGGLYVRVRETGGRSFVFVSKKGGKRKETVIGPVADITLAEARESRDRLRRGEPAHGKVCAASTFGEWADAWVAEQSPAWRNEVHRRQWRNTFDVQAKALRDLPVAAVDTDAVLGVLRPMWSTHQETASRIRGRLERVLDAARAAGLITGPWENPARWRGHLAHLLPPRRKLASRGHQAAMPYAEVPAFVATLRTRPATAARALEFTILGANRTGEVIGAKWSEVDLEAKTWTVPAERMKMGVAHRVPLTAPMMAILEEMGPDRRRTDYVFPGQKTDKPLSNMAMSELLKRMKHSDITVHGFRSAFRDWAGEETEHAESVAEAALAHSVGNATVRAYRRGDAFDRRHRLMDDWAKFVERGAPAFAEAPAPPVEAEAPPKRSRGKVKHPGQVALFGDETSQPR